MTWSRWTLYSRVELPAESTPCLLLSQGTRDAGDTLAPSTTTLREAAKSQGSLRTEQWWYVLDLGSELRRLYYLCARLRVSLSCSPAERIPLCLLARTSRPRLPRLGPLAPSPSYRDLVVPSLAPFARWPAIAPDVLSSGLLPYSCPIPLDLSSLLSRGRFRAHTDRSHS